ncbi:putative E3 ubiquitin ligase [Handroanthus impetiginosus]|uniref:Putative E3 ubiquitin ligase n=1 Tax=Handroanthus impetiginosus TaxID=429701 RepID=A0A2G9GRW2_9LAMI|nr:putative E3 ubiquitin ligase [Handroanthus impetiginosus]
MRKSFKDSLKALEADIQHANTLASDYPREYDGACLQMRLSYSPCAHFFLFLVQWADCYLAGALGLIRILIYKVYADGKTTMSVYERKASLRQFYATTRVTVASPLLNEYNAPSQWIVLYFGGLYVLFDASMYLREICATKYRRDEMDKGKLSEIDIEREEECGICMELNTKVVLPGCSHSLCMNCYRNWRARSQSCPFCRDSLKRMNSGELWIYPSNCDIVDLSAIARENLKRLFMYIDKLPIVVPDPIVVSYYPHFR